MRYFQHPAITILAQISIFGNSCGKNTERLVFCLRQDLLFCPEVYAFITCFCVFMLPACKNVLQHVDAPFAPETDKACNRDKKHASRSRRCSTAGKSQSNCIKFFCLFTFGSSYGRILLAAEQTGRRRAASVGVARSRRKIPDFRYINQRNGGVC